MAAELQERIAPVAEELDALACGLEDGELELEPACAIAWLLTDAAQSPLRTRPPPPGFCARESARSEAASGPRRVAA